MPPIIKSTNELNEYIATLESRLARLENSPSHNLPETNLLSKSFWKRAFTVWGHFFAANLVISTIVFAVYLCVVLVLFGSILNQVHK